jgi:hypothetical protein
VEPAGGLLALILMNQVFQLIEQFLGAADAERGDQLIASG